MASTRPRTTLRPMPRPRRDPCARVGPRRNRSKSVPSSSSGTPGPPSSTTRRTMSPSSIAWIDTGASVAACAWTLSSRFVMTISSRTSSASTGGRVSGTSIRIVRSPRLGRSRSMAGWMTDHSSWGSRSGWTPPEAIRLRSSKPLTSRSSRAASVSMTRAAARRASSVHGTAGSASPPAVARMLANGVRRSWETESMRAVLSASVWRATSSSVAVWRS